MEEIMFVFPTLDHEQQAKEFVEEHIRNNEYTIHGDGGLDTASSYINWLSKVTDDNNEWKCEQGKVRATVFFAVRKIDNKIVGIIQIRHALNEVLKIYGHIGYNVRPSERRKGYATLMLKKALEYCKSIGISDVLLSCDKSNIASARTIIKFNAVLENEITQEDSDELLQRYWIKI